MIQRFAGFRGLLPRLHARYLPDGFAQIAHNVRLDDNALSPIKAPVTTETLGSVAGTFALVGGQWRSWTARNVKPIAGPVAADRLYVFGDGAPKMESGGTTYSLALPAPATAPAVEVLGGAPDPLVVETPVMEVLYVYTWVTGFGEESAPSPQSQIKPITDGSIVRLSSFASAPSGRNITGMRVYRSQTSLAGDTSLYFVKELNVIETSYDHDVTVDPLQELLPTANFSTPKATLKGAVALPNGMMAAFHDRELYFCEPYQPHSWPTGYMLTTEVPIVALAALGSTLFILTVGRPYIAQGSAPESMFMQQLDFDLPCVNAEGVADLGYTVVYPSSDGLVSLSQSGGSIVTGQIFSREDWQALDPTTIVATSYDGRYLFSYSGGGGRQIGMIDLRGDRPFFATADGEAAAFFKNTQNGIVYFLDASDNRTIKRWDHGSNLTYTWRSKPIVLPTLTNFGAILIDADGAPGVLSVEVHADGALRHTETTANQPERLPGDFLAREWEVEVVSNGVVSFVAIAGTVEELWS